MKSFGEGKIRTGRSGEGEKKWGPLSSEKSFLPSPIFPLISKTTCAMPTKQPMPPVPPLQPLLFWETGVLLFVAGIVALIEVLNVLKNDSVRISLGEQKNPALIRMPDNDNFKFVVMPMKI